MDDRLCGAVFLECGWEVVLAAYAGGCVGVVVVEGET